ncbi:MAG: hypothetical protein U0V72_11970 [Cytophagales bacterium]
METNKTKTVKPNILSKNIIEIFIIFFLFLTFLFGKEVYHKYMVFKNGKKHQVQVIEKQCYKNSGKFTVNLQSELLEINSNRCSTCEEVQIGQTITIATLDGAKFYVNCPLGFRDFLGVFMMVVIIGFLVWFKIFEIKKKQQKFR